ncbi:hypothetical protein CRG98_045082 [Punica granatum]|uniref:Uncharacterized protein n=1 Tax=Punica granatum TaxID=22663 RepID=A0A2I0HS54_PUNGR|nr:hypothetical protein CRG98_045082 [Punica granatum]
MYDTTTTETVIQGRQLQHTDEMSFFDKAAVVTPADQPDGPIDLWRLCTVTQIPSASLSLFDTLSVIFWGLIRDQIIVPFARRYKRHESGFTQLQCMGIGLAISVVAMVVAGALEVFRLNTFLIGCAEVSTVVGQLEFFYDQALDGMRSLCSALSLTTIALRNYLTALLVTIVICETTRSRELGWIPNNMNKGRLY